MLSIHDLSPGIIACVVIVGFCWLLSFFAILIGLCCLWKSPHNLNQKIILLNLSVTELTFNVTIPLRLIPYFMSCTTCWYLARLESWIGFWYYVSLFFITMDRFLCMRLSVRYKQVVTPRCLKKTSGLISFLSLLCSLPFYFMDSKTVQLVVNVLIYPIMDFLFVAFAVVVYLFIFYKLRKYSKELGKVKNTAGTLSAEKSFRKSYLTPMLIILSFMVFIQIPQFYIIFSVYLKQASITVNDDDEKTTFVKSLIIYGCYFVGFACDSVIYMYINKTVCRLILEKLCCCTRLFSNRANFLKRRRVYIVSRSRGTI